MHNNMPEQKQLRVLLAVQDGKARSALRGYFRARGDVVELRPGRDLPETIRAQKPQLILLEIEARSRLMSSLHDEFRDIPIVAVAPLVSDLAFEAAKLGAAALLTLPLDQREIESRLSPVLQLLSNTVRGRGKQAIRTPVADNVAAVQGPPGLFNSSPRMMEIRDTIEKVATTNATVLIRGESGVGKEIAARLIFSLSHRRDKPFVKVNCAAIPQRSAGKRALRI